MLESLKAALNQCRYLSTFKSTTSIKYRGVDQLNYFFSHINYADEYSVDDRIQILREQEKQHKDAACELIVQATGEAIATGASAAAGMEIPALAEGILSTRHFIEGCKEYNEGVRCQHEADLLEQEIDPEDKQSEKKCWEFWK